MIFGRSEMEADDNGCFGLRVTSKIDVNVQYPASFSLVSLPAL